MADSLGELAPLQQEGKIRHIGLSQVSVDELAAARRMVPIVSVQNRYNVVDRSAADVLAVCERERLAFIPWAPIASGSAEKLESGGAWLVSDGAIRVASELTASSSRAGGSPPAQCVRRSQSLLVAGA